MAIKKINVNNEDFELGGDNVKVADLAVGVDQEYGVVWFGIDDIPMDYLKGVRVEIFDNNNLIYTWFFKGMYIVTLEDYIASPKLITTLLEQSPQSYEYYVNVSERLGGAEFNYGGFSYYSWLSFEMLLNENNEMLIDANNLTAKVYYCEPNINTQLFYYVY